MHVVEFLELIQVFALADEYVVVAAGFESVLHAPSINNGFFFSESAFLTALQTQ